MELTLHGFSHSKCQENYAPGEKTEEDFCIWEGGWGVTQSDSFMRSLWPFEKNVNIFISCLTSS